MGFSRQECWSGLPFPSPEDLSDLGTELAPPVCTAGGFFTPWATWKAHNWGIHHITIRNGALCSKDSWGVYTTRKKWLDSWRAWWGEEATEHLWRPAHVWILVPSLPPQSECFKMSLPGWNRKKKKKKNPQPADMNNKIESNKYIQSFLRQQNSPDLSPQALQAVITPPRDTPGRLQSGWGGSSGVDWPGCQPQSWLSPLLAGPVKLLILPVPPGPHSLSEETNRTCCTAVGGFEENTGKPWSGVWHILNTLCSGYCCYVCCSLTASWRVPPVYGPRLPHALAGWWHDYCVGLEGDECRAGPSHLLSNTCGLKRSYLGGKLSV